MKKLKHSCTKSYLQACWRSLLFTLVLGVSTAPGFAQIVMSRGEQRLSITEEEAMRRAPLALQAEGFSLDQQGTRFIFGRKGIHAAYILWNAAPDGKTWINVVVASQANDGGVPGWEREKLQMQMDPLGSNLNLSGTWYRTDDPNKRTSITQTGNTLTFTNEFGNSSKGRFLDATTIVATDWQGGLRGRISSDGSRIDWANGTSWSRNVGKPKIIQSLIGAWCRTGEPQKRCSITQTADTLTFTNESGNSSKGRFLDATTVVATEWEGGLRGRISSDGSRIDWANGTSWSKIE